METMMWPVGVLLRRYIVSLILLIPTPLLYLLFFAASLLFVHFVIFFPVLVVYRPLQLLESTAKFSVLI